MKEAYELNIKEVYGLTSPDSLGIQIQLSSADLKCFIPLSDKSQDEVIELPHLGIVQIAIRPLSAPELLYGAKFHLKDLPLTTDICVPLFECTCPLVEFPIKQFTVPAVLLSLTELDKPTTSPEEQLSTKDNESAFITGLTQSNRGLRGKVLELEKLVNQQNWEFAGQVQHMKYTNNEENAAAAVLVNRLKSQVRNYRAVKEDLRKQYVAMEAMYKQEKQQREHIEQANVDLAKNRENELLTELRGTNKKLDSVSAKNIKLQQENRQLSLDNSELKNQLSVLESLGLQCRYASLLGVLEDSESSRKALQEELEFSTSVHDKELESILREKNNESATSLQQENANLKARINEYAESLTAAQNQSELLTSDSYTNTAELQLKTQQLNVLKTQSAEQGILMLSTNSQAASLTQQVCSLKKELKQTQEEKTQLEDNYSSLQQSHRKSSRLLQEAVSKSEKLKNQLRHENLIADKKKPTLKSDNADERFNEYLRDYGIEDEFVRVAEGVYTFGSKKVSVSIKNNCLVCRVGGGYMMIDEFIRLFIKQDDNEGKTPTTRDLSPEIAHRRVVTVGSTMETPKKLISDDEDKNPKENKNLNSPYELKIPKSAITHFKPTVHAHDWSTGGFRKNAPKQYLTSK